MLDKNKLYGKIRAHGLTLENVARFLGINAATLSRKVNGRSDFTRNEIEMLRRKLSLTADELQAIFFAQELA